MKPISPYLDLTSVVNKMFIIGQKNKFWPGQDSRTPTPQRINHAAPFSSGLAYHIMISNYSLKLK
jgi:hypothetical protein